MALVLVTLVVVHVVFGHGGDRSHDSKAKTVAPASRHSPAARSAITPSVVATVPAAFAGTWSGQVQQPPDDTYSVSLTLGAGMSTATVSYSTPGLAGCSPSLTLTQAGVKELTLSQAAEGGCTAGTVTITRTGRRTVWYHFSGGGLDATGTLTRG